MDVITVIATMPLQFKGINLLNSWVFEPNGVIYSLQPIHVVAKWIVIDWFKLVLSYAELQSCTITVFKLLFHFIVLVFVCEKNVMLNNKKYYT